MGLPGYWLQQRPQDGAALGDNSQAIAARRQALRPLSCIRPIKVRVCILDWVANIRRLSTGPANRKGKPHIDGGKNEFESTRNGNRTGVGGGTSRGPIVGTGPGGSARSGAGERRRCYRSGRVPDLSRRIRMGIYFRIVAQTTVRLCPAAGIHRVLH